jgi:hypothetical protein
MKKSRTTMRYKLEDKPSLIGKQERLDETKIVQGAGVCSVINGG